MNWLIFILGVAQFPVNGFVFDGMHKTFSYQIGTSTYTCTIAQLVSFSVPPHINLKGSCPADRISYSGFQ
jgi:hypothetical protein